jgi:hypothetical protein
MIALILCLVFDFISVDTFSAVVCKVLDKCICLGVPVGSFPVSAKILPPALNYFPYIVNVLTGALLEVILSFTDVVLVTEFAPWISLGASRKTISSIRHWRIL